MKTIKLIALLLAAVLGLSACQAKPAEPEQIDYADLAGMVAEITDAYLLITTPDQGDVQVNLSEATAWEGDAIAVGDYIHVTFDGKMTRSLPPQVSAIKIGCYVRTGVASAVEDGVFTLSTEGEEIRVNADPALMADVAEGQTVTVYFNGAMTMSLPAQIGAEHVVIRN